MTYGTSDLKASNITNYFHHTESEYLMRLIIFLSMNNERLEEIRMGWVCCQSPVTWDSFFQNGIKYLATELWKIGELLQSPELLS